MKTPLASLGSLTAILLALGCATPLASAAVTYLQWGGDYVSQSEALQGDTPANRAGGSDKYGDPDPSSLPSGPVIVGRYFSTSTAFSPTSGYSGASFFGGGSVTNEIGTNEGFHELSVRNNGPTDGIHWQVDSAGGDHHTNHLFIYFQQPQFTTGFDSGTVGLNLNGYFSLHTDQVTGSGGSGVDLRWVIRDSGSFWISENVNSLSSNSTFTDNFSAITGWAAYSPTNGSFTGLDFDPLSATFASRTFSNVEGLGFYVEHENPLNATQATHVDISRFTVAVPEPSRLLLTGFGVMMAFLRRSRRIA